MERYFENLPVYVAYLTGSTATAQPEAKGLILPRSALDAQDDLHPLVITTTRVPTQQQQK